MAYLRESDWQRAAARIRKASRILLTTHVRPDGDALGSAAALQHALTERYPEKTVDCLLLSPVPDNYLFLLDFPYQTLDKTLPAEQLPAFTAGFELVIAVDTCAVAQLPQLGTLLTARPHSTLVIDHHLHRDSELSDCIIADTAASAAGQIVLEFIQKLPQALSPSAAEALFTAIASDTGWFRFENTSPECFRDAAVLARAGIDIEKIYRRLYADFPFARTKLVAKALDSIELYAEGAIALMTVTNAMLQATGAKREHIENLVNECQNIDTVQTWALLVETKDPQTTRCSFRSRGNGVNVNDIARQFQGGGHARAAGATLPLPLTPAKEAVLKILMQATER